MTHREISPCRASALSGRQASAPLFEAIVKHIGLDLIPFHVPGHKQGRGRGQESGIDPEFAEFLGHDALAMDLTEVPGLDDLHAPGGPIREAEDLASELFGADHTFFLVNGTSAGIQAAMMATCGPGDEILIPRDVHRSVIGGLILSGASPVYIPVAVHPEFGIPLGPVPECLLNSLRAYPSAKLVVLTNPNYYGVTRDLRYLVNLCHQYGKIVLVDEAHGGHFAFDDALPPSGLSAGADIVVQSTHKTLGSLTQSSMLHVKGQRVDMARLRQALRILQTTSPSYILMASLDAARRRMFMRGRELVGRAVRLAERARGSINQIIPGGCLSLPALDPARAAVDAHVGPHAGRRPVEAVCGGMCDAMRGELLLDPTKLTISFRGIGVSGYRAGEVLRERYGLQVEFADMWNVLAMVTIADRDEDVDRLIEGIKGLSDIFPGQYLQCLQLQYLRCLQHLDDVFSAPPQHLPPRQACLGRTEAVLLKEAAGRVSAEIVAPYPPGIPVICPGEEVTPGVIEFLTAARELGARFQGPEDPDLTFLRVVDG
ncbi:MAG TPA: aminotransferase class I/II-fold pyridoxal phosphate-dependent enzyme [Firmicutes bacterium]|nr:aminotransferase class I/II-fold pyridoxal phosphate-dependent enzyme [Bacillota bacterium]